MPMKPCKIVFYVRIQQKVIFSFIGVSCSVVAFLKPANQYGLYRKIPAVAWHGAFYHLRDFTFQRIDNHIVSF